MPNPSEIDPLAPFFRALTTKSTEGPDPNRIVQLACAEIPSEAQKEWEEIASLDPVTREALVALKESATQEIAPTRMSGAEREIANTITKARACGNLRVAYTEGGLFRVADPQGSIGISPWLAKVFDMTKRMLGDEGLGIWPTNRVQFSFPGVADLLQASFTLEGGHPVFSVRLPERQSTASAEEEVDIEYWRGNQWIGAETLCEEEPELNLRLETAKPYLLRIGKEDTNILRVTCYSTEFSPTELRIAALARVLSGDVDGGFEIIRTGLASPTRAYRWAMTLLARCLPEPALQMGYAAVRDVTTQEEIETCVRDLFSALANGWLNGTGLETDLKNVKQRLQQTRSPIAEGFLLALDLRYEEALSTWDSAEETDKSNKHVTAARILADQMLREPTFVSGLIDPIGDKDIDIAMNCLTALGLCRKPGEEDFDRLAESFAAACR